MSAINVAQHFFENDGNHMCAETLSPSPSMFRGQVPTFYWVNVEQWLYYNCFRYHVLWSNFNFYWSTLILQNCPMLIFDGWNLHFSCLLLLYNIFLPVNVDWLYPHFTYLSFHSNWSNVALCCLSPPCAWRMETDLHGTLNQWVDLRGQLQSTPAAACFVRV